MAAARVTVRYIDLGAASLATSSASGDDWLVFGGFPQLLPEQELAAVKPFGMYCLHINRIKSRACVGFCAQIVDSKEA
jgi:hypothetical protein